MNKLLHKLKKQEHGAVGAEFALVIALFIVILFATLDFARVWWNWNMASKATQAAAREAIVSAPVSDAVQNFDGLDIAAGNGIRLERDQVGSVRCTSSGCTCTGSCTALTSGNLNNVAFNRILARAQAFYPRATAENLVVTYTHFGLGFVGNPFGLDYSPAVTVELTGLTFNFVTPILLGLGDLTMPVFRATLTGEDLACTGAC